MMSTPSDTSLSVSILMFRQMPTLMFLGSSSRTSVVFEPIPRSSGNSGTSMIGMPLYWTAASSSNCLSPSGVPRSAMASR